MKVLVIDEWMPWPLDSGKKIRTYNLIKRLAEWHEVIFLGYANGVKDKEKIAALEDAGVRTWPVEDVRVTKWSFGYYVCVAINFISKEAFSSTYHITKKFRAAVRKAIEIESPQLVHCEWTNLAPVLTEVNSIPRVISAHNIESMIWKRLEQNGSNFLYRVIGRQQARKMESLERKWYPRVERCISVSVEDKKVIESYGGKAELVENGVDIKFFRDSAAKIEPKTLSFTASFDTFSNQDAVDYFINDIFPLIKLVDPDVKLWLVGKDPPKKMLKYGVIDQSIKVTGTVQDVRDYIKKAEICIVPIRIGGGSRLKILEALSMKKPVVSTSVGAEGLRVENGKNIIIADSPKHFADEVIGLLNDSFQKKQRLGEEGYSLVSREYDWEILARRQSEIWNSVLKN